MLQLTYTTLFCVKWITTGIHFTKFVSGNRQYNQKGFTETNQLFQRKIKMSQLTEIILTYNLKQSKKRLDNSNRQKK